MKAVANACVLGDRIGYNGGRVAGLVTLSMMLGVLGLTFALRVLC